MFSPYYWFHPTLESALPKTCSVLYFEIDGYPLNWERKEVERSSRRIYLIIFYDAKNSREVL